MRVLFTVPHYYDAVSAEARHGSLNSAAREGRRRALDSLIFQIHSLFGRKTFAANHVSHTLVDSASAFAFDFDILICTTGEKHLLGELECPRAMYAQVKTTEQPPFLGFACHEVMVQLLGKYDYYCYLEDDIVIFDQLFFLKLEMFNRTLATGVQPSPVLQPQRYEVSLGAGTDGMKTLTRVYMDYLACEPPAGFSQPIQVQLLGRSFILERSTHPHSGCFFLNRAQMEHIAQQSIFLDRSQIWTSPLDTAATLALMKSFPVYKPALECLGFLDVCHAHQAMVQQVERDGLGLPLWRALGT